MFHPPPHKENRSMQSHRLKKQKPKTHNLDLSSKGTSPNSVPSMRNFGPPTGSKSKELPPDFYPLHHLGQLFSLTEIIFSLGRGNLGRRVPSTPPSRQPPSTQGLLSLSQLSTTVWHFKIIF